jgi:hypothetical protein
LSRAYSFFISSQAFSCAGLLGQKSRLFAGSDNKVDPQAWDAALMPYHVDRSKLFVMDRIAKSKLLDAGRITSAIECTRFPPAHGPNDKNNEEGSLVRAADLIGQLGDRWLTEQVQELDEAQP